MRIILYFHDGTSVISPFLECDNSEHKGFERLLSIKRSASKTIISMKRYGLIEDGLLLHNIEELTNANTDKPEILVVGDSLDEKLLNQLKEDLSDYELISNEDKERSFAIIGTGADMIASNRAIIHQLNRTRGEYPPRTTIGHEMDIPHITNEIQRIEHISENSSWVTARHEISPYGNRKQRRTQMANHRKSLRNKK